MKPSSSRSRAATATPTQTVDIASLLNINDKGSVKNVSKSFNSRTSLNQRRRMDSSINPSQGLFIIRRKTSSPRYSQAASRFSTHGYGQSRARQLSFPYNSRGLNGLSSQLQLQQNRRSFNTLTQPPPFLNSNKAKLAWMALLAARQRQRSLNALNHFYASPSPSLSPSPSAMPEKSQYYKSIMPLLYQYKMQKQETDKYYAKYLKTLQLLALATSQSSDNFQFSPELGLFMQSFKNSPYGSLLKNSTFVSTNSVDSDMIQIQMSGNGTNTNEIPDQIAEASEASDRSDTGHHEYSSLHYEIEKQKRKLLEVFPPPQSEVPFGERTILMVRFPPVPEDHRKDTIRLSKEYDIDGGITFGGPRWLSFGKPFDPFDHPWYHTTPPPHKPTKYVLAEAEKPSGYGVIISQNFIYKPTIRFTNSDPKHLAKHKGDLLNGGPSIVTQLAKALAEGNRISNSYYLSKNVWQGKTWANPEMKRPFVIVHLDSYTKKANETGHLGLDEDIEANYANGTIIYPTKNDPNILASTKFEFHNAHEIDHIFEKPLAILGHGHGWGKVPVYPKGIKEIKNFLRLMYKVHMEQHERAKKKAIELKKVGDKLERPALAGSKPLLRDQIADRSTTWFHTTSVGIRSLSEDDDHFPYATHPVIDVSKDYDHFL